MEHTSSWRPPPIFNLGEQNPSSSRCFPLPIACTSLPYFSGHALDTPSPGSLIIRKRTHRGHLVAPQAWIRPHSGPNFGGTVISKYNRGRKVLYRLPPPTANH
eukprot:1417247-Pyramimonas_sp.AAC.1